MMNDDSKVILMLCGRLGKDTDVEPLKQSEYTRIVRWLVSNQMRPADLLEPEIANSAAASANLPAARLADLLKRGVQLGFAVESWNRSAYRIFVPKADWTNVLAGLGDDLDYDNFKSAVARHQGHNQYEHALHDVWGVMYGIQEAN